MIPHYIPIITGYQQPDLAAAEGYRCSPATFNQEKVKKHGVFMSGLSLMKSMMRKNWTFYKILYYRRRRWHFLMLVLYVLMF